MLTKLRCFLVCTILLSPSTLQAQLFGTATVVPVAGSPTQTVSGDFNRDGRADIVYQDAYSGGSLHVMLGNGDGTFTTGQVIPMPDTVGTVITVGDINGDGIPDLAIGYTGFGGYDTPASIAVLLGKGDGTFAPPVYSSFVSSGSPAQMTSQMGIADFDGDGHPDLVYSDGFHLFIMKGNGTATLGAPQQIPGSVGGNVAVADLNGDGRPDLVTIGSSSGAVYLNEAGTLTLTSPYNISGAGSTFLGDLDGDGHPDIVAVAPYGGAFSVSYGRADGTFAAAVPLAGSVTNHVPIILGLADLHNDRKQRVIVASSDGVSEVLGDAPNPAPLYEAGTNYFFNAVIADFNGDGYADIAMPGDNSIVLLLGQPDGTFTAAPSIQTNIYVGNFTVLDDTGDQIPDIIMSNDRVLPGKGDGTFGAAIGTGGSFPFLEYSGDFDGDGHLGFFADGEIYANNGDGTFAPRPLQIGGFSTGFAVVADFNNDGHSDVAYSTSVGDFAEPETTGNEVTVATSSTGTTHTYTSLSFPEPVGPLGAGDFNGDGCKDLVVGAATQIEIFLGDCHGNFQPGVTYPTNTGATVLGGVGGFPSSLEPSDIAVADFDGDGNLDIVYTVPGLSLAKILYGRGDGTFVAGTDLVLPDSSIYVATADLDGDGNPDLVFTGQGAMSIYRGQKSRSFGSPSVYAAGYKSGKAVVADLNRDGNPDIVVPNLDFDGGDDSDDSGFTFAVFMNQLPAKSSNALNVSLTVTPEPSLYGQAFTATAKLSPVTNSAIPTGGATFTLDGASPITVSLDSTGSASATFPSASVGSHVIAVSYPGDTNFASASASVNHQVSGDLTTTTLTSTPNPSTYLQPVTFTAHVASASGTPTGSILFTEAQNTLATVPVDASGNASFSISTLSANDLGTTPYHLINATYVPTGGFTASSSSVPQVVNGLTSNTLLTVTPTSGTTATTFSMTATVTSGSPSSTTPPTGTVVFYTSAQTGIPGNELGYATLVNGVASFTSTGLLSGTDYIVGIYFGDGIYASSTSNYVPLTVTASPTTLSLTSSANPSPALTPITFTAHLATASGPTANAALTLTYNPTGNAEVVVPLTTDANGNASFTLASGLIPGSYSIAANFAATATYQASAAPLTELVTANPTTTTLAATPNPTTQNNTVTLIATVAATAGTAAPFGTVTFLDGITPLATITLTASTTPTSTATYSTSAFTVGTHQLSAIYTPGGTSFLASQSLTVAETINPQDFTLTANPPTITIQTLHHASMPLTLTSIGGFNASITTTCGQLPPFATCSLSSPTQLAASGTATVTLALDTSGVPDFLSSNERSNPASRIALATLLPLTLFGFTRRRRLRQLAAIAFLAILGLAVTACANTYPDHTPPGVYNIPITSTGQASGASAPTTHTLDITLTVTQ